MLVEFLRCEEATRLISQGLDAGLRPRARLALRLHLLLCTWCRRYRVQVLAVRAALRRQADDPRSLPEEDGLPPAARRRIGAALGGHL